MGNRHSRSVARSAPRAKGDSTDMRSYVRHLAAGGEPHSASGALTMQVGKKALMHSAKKWLVAAQAETASRHDDHRSLRGNMPWHQLPPLV